MQRALFFLLLLVAPVAAAQPAPPPSIAAKTWLLLDLQSQQVLAERGADERVEPASLTKLMTAYVVFEALRQKRITADEALVVSEKAWRMPGSRMFLKQDTSVTVAELLRGMIVVSGNDATVALAEGVGGTEAAFVERMNAQARRMGLNATHFVNATGLPDPQHYSTARDLARLSAALVRDFREYLPLYQQRELTYNKITQPNRNPLLGRDPRVEGLKTGYTEDAGYCLIALGHWEQRMLVSVVMGTSSESARGVEAQKLLNYGFQYFETPLLYAKGALVADLPVWKGSEKRVKAAVAQDIYASVPRGQANGLKASLTSQQPLLAPVTVGQQVGVLKVAFDGRALAEYPVVAQEGVGVANLVVRMWDSMRLLFQ